MSMKDKTIRIDDWACNLLFIGDYDDPKVDEVLDANRCDCENGCDDCDNTGYIGDFEVRWVDEDQQNDPEMNVYEYINH